MLTLLAAADQIVEAAGAATAVWERLASFGALGIICAWLLWERTSDRKADRASRAKQAEALQDNTEAMHANTSRIGELARVLYLFVGRRHDDTPPQLRKPTVTQDPDAG